MARGYRRTDSLYRSRGHWREEKATERAFLATLPKQEPKYSEEYLAQVAAADASIRESLARSAALRPAKPATAMPADMVLLFRNAFTAENSPFPIKADATDEEIIAHAEAHKANRRIAKKWQTFVRKVLFS